MCEVSVMVSFFFELVRIFIILFGKLEVVSIFVKVIVYSGNCFDVRIIYVFLFVIVGSMSEINLISEVFFGVIVFIMLVGLRVEKLKCEEVIGFMVLNIW